MKCKQIVQAMLLVLLLTAVSLPSELTQAQDLIPQNSSVSTFCIPTTGAVTQRYSGSHPGIDIASGTSPGVTPVYAAYGGLVVYRGTMNLGSTLDAAIAINHGQLNGVYVLSHYHHMGHGSTSYVVVSVGDSVSQGQLIGYQGDAPEYATSGVHLHFGIHEKSTPFLDGYYSWGTCATTDLWREFDGSGCPNPGTAVSVNPESSSYLGSLPNYVTQNCPPGDCCCSSYAAAGEMNEIPTFSFREQIKPFSSPTVDKSPEPTDIPNPVDLPEPAKTLALPDPTPISIQRAPVEPQRTPPTSASYRIPKSVFGSGGGLKTSTHYVMNSTQGQSTDLSSRQSASYVLVPGYWSSPATGGYKAYLPLVVKHH